ncbi:MAG: class I SAM-dependent methyltransferase [Anaerolineales bacterium]|jgi:SAM-dependent methyltransferase
MAEKSKEWNWSANVEDRWRIVADELLPVALLWKNKNYRNILDLGCGIGRNALYLAKMGFSVSAFDLAADGLAQLYKEARRGNLNIDVKLGDMITLPYKSGFFDCVLAFHSIYHTDYDGLIKVLSEIRRVIRKDGQIFITFNSKDSDSWNLFSDRRIDEYTLYKTEGPEVDIPHTYLEYADVLNLMKEFHILKIQQILDYRKDRKHAHFFVTAERI